jgi:hypothetical protein
MTIRAGRRDVRASQRELGIRVVIELGAGERLRRVTRRACSWEPGVRRILGRIIIALMTRYAFCAASGEHLVGVARSARLRDVRTGQRKRRFGVIEPGTEPARRVVTAAAFRAEVCRCVVRRCRLTVIGCVTTHALGWRVHKLGTGSARRRNMARGAIGAGMRAAKREARQFMCARH